jgi:hypothetical protein
MPLVLIGGALGGGLGGLATAVNAGVARRRQMAAVPTAIAMLSVTAFAYGTYFIVADTLKHTMDTPRKPAVAEPTPTKITRSPIPPSSVPTSVVVTPGVIGPAGVELTWPAFVNATGLPAGDVMGYLVYRSGPYKPFTAPTSEVIARLGPHDTRYVDSAVPALTGPNGGSYTYRVTVWTRSPLNQMTFSGLQDENPGLDPTLVITYTSPKRAGQVRTPTRPSPYAPMPLA